MISGHATSFYINKNLFLVAQIRRAITNTKSGNTMAFIVKKIVRRKERKQIV
jgi:ATP-dependent RNA helicase DDX5/DBP2